MDEDFKRGFWTGLIPGLILIYLDLYLIFLLIVQISLILERT